MSTGHYTVADGNYSTAMGENQQQAGSFAAIGLNSSATGTYSVAIGATNTSSGYASTTLGDSNWASGRASTAMVLELLLKIMQCSRLGVELPLENPNPEQFSYSNTAFLMGMD